MYDSVEAFEKVFIYLMDGKTPISYWKGDVNQFTNPEAKYQWIILQNDKSIGKVKESYMAGIIQVKISIRKRGLLEHEAYDYF